MNEKVAERIKMIRQILDDYENGKYIKVFVEQGRDDGVWIPLNADQTADIDDLFSEFTDNYRRVRPLKKNSDEEEID